MHFMNNNFKLCNSYPSKWLPYTIPELTIKRSDRSDPAAVAAFKFLWEDSIMNLGRISHANMINAGEHLFKYLFNTRNVPESDITILELS